nr:immunoglobulin light chain junction region [Macaca mulatta]MOX71115.1 immunoglobulin light chain junction region [Macaca mulatta]MOX71827.1 immunoglobulin light chain junction region [Macaca mulatta]MOX73495.1 immunoglobulin light chain junction region [Macaca mulatta]MOX74184.1 immunoglobulin light chain junction region [Macaca mulatta]
DYYCMIWHDNASLF